MASKNGGKICFWINDATEMLCYATEMLIELWSEETIQFALESSNLDTSHGTVKDTGEFF